MKGNNERLLSFFSILWLSFTILRPWANQPAFLLLLNEKFFFTKSKWWRKWTLDTVCTHKQYPPPLHILSSSIRNRLHTHSQTLTHMKISLAIFLVVVVGLGATYQFFSFCLWFFSVFYILCKFSQKRKENYLKIWSLFIAYTHTHTRTSSYYLVCP